MTSPLTPEARLRTARILHGSLMAGVLIFLLVTAWVHRVAAAAAGSVGSVLGYAGLAVLAAALVTVRVLPRPDPAPGPGQATDQWWVTSQARLIVRWAVLDGACLANAVLWFISRDPVSLGATVVGLVVLFVLRPGRYLE